MSYAAPLADMRFVLEEVAALDQLATLPGYEAASPDPVDEMWNSACMSFALCPLLTVGAVELLQAHGSNEQKRRYLGKLVSGEWTGTMNLTEPQAGSDLGAMRSRAVPAHNPRWGEHYR